MHFSSIDIFCHVVDNFGDIGVVYRFSKEFAIRHPSCRVRVFCDDMIPLSLMVPGVDKDAATQEINGITYIDSDRLTTNTLTGQLGPSDVVVEAFGCEIPHLYQNTLLSQAAVWVNLEHLSAEPWVDGYHLRPSLVTGSRVKKFFYMPGFTENTGGVIIDSAAELTRPGLTKNRLAYLNGVLEGFRLRCNDVGNSLFGAIFTYVRGFDTLLAGLQRQKKDAYLFVLGDKSRLGMIETLKRSKGAIKDENHYAIDHVHVLLMPFVPQDQFDSLLCVSDFNLVRGEDSLVRAILAQKPFIWSAYLQNEKYHRTKIKAFLDVYKTYFDDASAYALYRDVTEQFNDMAKESPFQVTREQYDGFFGNLMKIEHATKGMSYFMTRKCSLIDKFTDFLSVI
jgi:uncharacterized repeat protein (TIGR03837 family)